VGDGVRLAHIAAQLGEHLVEGNADGNGKAQLCLNTPADFMGQLVAAGYNIFVSGATSSGKTTFLNVLADDIPGNTRIITIEDSAELRLHDIDNLVRLEVKPAGSEGTAGVTIRDLIKTSLRMRPDRLIVGEVRGPEALDMIQAMNTGHDGSMSTGHANSPEDMLSRLENMILMAMEIPLEAIRRQIASGIDVIVHLGRLRDKSRRVLEIVEVVGYEKQEYCLNTLFQFEEEGEDANGRIQGSLQEKAAMVHTGKLKAAGFKDV
jgi:pilus assembly protein CpaF